MASEQKKSPSRGRIDGWERTEARVVRPFRSLDHWLDDARIRICKGEEFQEGPTIHIEGVAREQLDLAIQIPLLSSGIEDLVGIPLEQLSLIVTCEDSVLKRSAVLGQLDVGASSGARVELGAELLKHATLRNETQITLALVLALDRAQTDGSAYRRGSWLARKTFTLGGNRNFATFNLKRVDERWFIQNGLPARSAYFVNILDGDLNQPCENIGDMIQVCIHEKLYDALAREDASASIQAFHASLYAEIAAAIIVCGFSNLQGEPSSGTVLFSVVERLSKATGVLPERIKQLARENGGTGLRAVVQAEADLLRHMTYAAARSI